MTEQEVRAYLDMLAWDANLMAKDLIDENYTWDWDSATHSMVTLESARNSLLHQGQALA